MTIDDAKYVYKERQNRQCCNTNEQAVGIERKLFSIYNITYVMYMCIV